MKQEQIFEKLWLDYTGRNPSAGIIHNLFTSEGEEVVNDHVAFRTIDHPLIDIEVMARPFREAGYVPMGEYAFKEKHLLARHFELPGYPSAPRVFISQLLLDECSPFLRNTMRELAGNLDTEFISSQPLIFAGSVFNSLSYELYQELRKESEYAAWFYVSGFRANHFTVSVNALRKYNDILKVNDLVKRNGFILNQAGGEIKGTPEELLQQSSTMADIIKIEFNEGIFEVPSCYYEFAQRFPGPDGKLYSGFIAASADKIFESTNFHTK